MPQDKLKSESSYRSLPLCDVVFQYLMKIKAQQDENRKVMGKEYDNRFNDFVCVNPMGTLLNPDYISDTFNKLLAKHNLRHIRFHDLRHSCASLLVKLGYNLKDIQEWLGHADFLITANAYSHVDMSEKIQMADSLSDSFKVTQALYVHLPSTEKV